jgi:hypothetical protein
VFEVGSVAGSLIGSEQFFALNSGAIIAPPVNPCEPGPGFIDEDGDGICDPDDFCLGSVADDPIRLGVNRFANIIVGGDPDFFETNKRGRADKTFTTEETQGCTCAQIVEDLPLNDEEQAKLDAGGTLRDGHEDFGCSSSIIEDWLAFLEDEGADGFALAALDEVAYAEAAALCAE